MKLFLVLAGIFGFLSVALGAFGAHALKKILSPEMLEAYKTGVQYQFFHTFALIAVALLLKWYPESTALTYAGYFFMAGIILFSGSLYGLSITGIKAFGPITPLGGLSFLIGWVFLIYAAIKILG